MTHASTRRLTLLSLAASLAVGRSSAGAQERTRLSFASAGQGSAFLPFAQAAAAAIARRAPIDVSVRETRGSNENVELVDRGECDLAALNLGPAFDAWNGRGPFAGRPLRGVRALAPMYETPFHTIALRGAGVATLRDLKGKRVGVGPAGGPGEVFFKGLAEELGIAAELVAGSPAELAAKVLSREVDAFWYGSGLPSPPFLEVAAKADAVVLGLQPDEAEAMRRRFPYFAPYRIAAGSYRGQDAPLPSAAVWNFVVARETLPEEVAHQVTKALLDGVAEVSARFPAAAAMTPAAVGANAVVPFHPGAARLYRERGVARPSVGPR